MDYQPLDLSKFWLDGYEFQGRFEPLECIKRVLDILKRDGTANKCKLIDSGLIDNSIEFGYKYDLYSKSIAPKTYGFYSDLVHDEEMGGGSIMRWNGKNNKFVGVGVKDILEGPFNLEEVPKALEKLIPTTSKEREFKHPGLEIIIFDTRTFDSTTREDFYEKDGKLFLKKEPKFYIFVERRLIYTFKKEIKCKGFVLV